MPIRINLLAEVRAAEEFRRKDPVKRAAWIGGFIVFLAGLWCVQKQTELMFSKAELARMSASWTAQEKKFQQVTGDLQAIGEIEARLNSLVRLSTNRFLWGTALHTLQTSLMDDIQFTRLHTEQTYRSIQGEPPHKVGNRTVPGKPGSTAERISIVIDGKDFARLQDQNYNRYKTSLSTNAFFAETLASVGGFKLLNLSPPISDAVDTARSYVTFSLEAQFPEILRDE